MLLIISSFFVLTHANPQGNFCGNIWGNPLKISLSKNVANISANIMGNEGYCKNEYYNYTNNHLYFSKNQTDCLNLNIKKWGGCPCPPNIIYNDKSLVIIGTPVGNVSLSPCR